MKYPCPCCSYLTLSEEPPGTFEICPVCYWEDDDVQVNNPDLPGGANEVSLNKARENYLECKASTPDFVTNVRPPLPEEIPN